MAAIQHNPDNVYPLYKSYSHAVEVKANTDLLFISGLNGYRQDGNTMPESFEEQGELVWQHIGTILKSAGMDYNHVISIRTYLADAKYDEANVALRVKYMQGNRPASTVIVSKLLDEMWKIEVEVVAART